MSRSRAFISRAATLPRLVHAIRTGRISVVHQSSLPEAAMYLPQRFGFTPENSIVLKELPVSTPLVRNLLVHEAVHAISDMKAQDIFLWQTEFFAYATSALVSLARDPASFSPIVGSLVIQGGLWACARDQGRRRRLAHRSPRRSRSNHRRIRSRSEDTFYYNPFLRLKEAIKTERPYILGWWKKMPTDGISARSQEVPWSQDERMAGRPRPVLAADTLLGRERAQ